MIESTGIVPSLRRASCNSSSARVLPPRLQRVRPTGVVRRSFESWTFISSLTSSTKSCSQLGDATKRCLWPPEGDSRMLVMAYFGAKKESYEYLLPRARRGRKAACFPSGARQRHLGFAESNRSRSIHPTSGQTQS